MEIEPGEAAATRVEATEVEEDEGIELKVEDDEDIDEVDEDIEEVLDTGATRFQNPDKREVQDYV